MAFFEDYTLLDELGAGAFAKVYKVRHNRLKYIRAIRVLNSTIALGEDDEAWKKFVNECSLLLRLGNGTHPNIVHIYQPLLKQQQALVEMDFIDGDDLTTYIKKHGPFLPIKEVIQLLRQIGSALAYCHYDIYRACMDREEDDLQDDPDDGSQVFIDDVIRDRLVKKYRVIHNDIHSGNIKRRTDGNYVLLDFGLAIESNSTMRSSITKNGAPEFKAPEKWDNDTALSTESDIYSFGIVLYEFMTGRVPFPIDSKNSDVFEAIYLVRKAHKESTPPSIYDLRKLVYEQTHPGEVYEKDYPEWLEELVIKCLAKRPADRFRDAKELYDYTEQQLAINPIEVKIVEKEVIVEKRVEVVDNQATQTIANLQQQLKALQEEIDRRECTAEDTQTNKEPEAIFEKEQILVTPISEPVIELQTPTKKKNWWGVIFVCVMIMVISILIGYRLFVGNKNNSPQIERTVAEPKSEVGESDMTQPITRAAYFNETVNGVDMKMIYVEGGTFTMGALSGDNGAYNDERPAHKVTLDSYYIAEFEVTQAQWKKVMGTTIYQQRDKVSTSWPLAGVGDNYPMYYVNYEEAKKFCEELSLLAGKTYLLPTEAQWQFAARGGNKGKNTDDKYSGNYSIDAVAWYDSNSNSTTHPVGQKLANQLGIYDMSGNVWEWCSDWYGSYSSSGQTNPTGPSSGAYRVLCGGSWRSSARDCRVSVRPYSNSFSRRSNCGFRVVCIP